MIFYYTATGNCLYAAKMIEKNLRSIPQELTKAELKYWNSDSYLYWRITTNCEKVY